MSTEESKRASIITREDAITIMKMEDVCDREGIGPDNDELLKSIMIQHPDLINGPLGFLFPR